MPGGVITAGRCATHYQRAHNRGDTGRACIRILTCGGRAVGSGGQYLFCNACLSEGWERCAPCGLIYLRHEQYRKPPTGKNGRRNMCRPCRTARAHQSRRQKALRLKAALTKAQAGICTWCFRPLPGDPSELHVDHIIPRSAGGPNRRWNYQVLHMDCNNEKSDTVTERARRLAADHGIMIRENPIAA